MFTSFITVIHVNNSLSGRVFFVLRIIAASSWPHDSLLWVLITMTDTDVTAVKIYFPEDGSIKVHQEWVTTCPLNFLAGCYWHGVGKQGPGHLPRWFKHTLCEEHILKHCLACAIHKIKYLAHGLDSNKTFSFALCFISRIAFVAIL